METDTQFFRRQHALRAAGRAAPESTNAALPPFERAEQLIEQLLERPIVQEAFALLREKLPPGLFYHNLDHTRGVFETALQLGIRDRLAMEELELLAVAAAWHDTGFIEKRALNEDVGSRLAAEAMRRHGYNDAQIALVDRMIMDTRLVPVPEIRTAMQVANCRLSGYLLDADLHNFGSERFFENMLKVYSEFQHTEVRDLDEAQRSIEGRNFLKATERLLEFHHWKTVVADELFRKQKWENLAVLRGYCLPPIV